MAAFLLMARILSRIPAKLWYLNLSHPNSTTIFPTQPKYNGKDGEILIRRRSERTITRYLFSILIMLNSWGLQKTFCLTNSLFYCRLV